MECHSTRRRATAWGPILANLEADIESLKIYAGIHQKYRGFYRALSNRFPFAIYYDLSGDMVDVYAVVDSRQDPPSLDEILGQRMP